MSAYKSIALRQAKEIENDYISKIVDYICIYLKLFVVFAFIYIKHKMKDEKYASRQKKITGSALVATNNSTLIKQSRRTRQRHNAQLRFHIPDSVHVGKFNVTFGVPRRWQHYAHNIESAQEPSALSNV